MTQEYDNALEELLEWGICERNKDGELKPTADFLVWYYDYLIHDITESYGGDWEETYTGEETEQELKEQEERDKEREEFVKDAIRNQIVIWTMQKIGKESVIPHTGPAWDEHVNIVDRLIKEIDHRLFNVMAQKTGQKRLDDD